MTNYNRLKRIDGLRAVAIIGVIAIHSTALRNTDHYFNLFDFGKYGVQLFFLLSGFILCYVADNSKFETPIFFLKRFFRLTPMYYLVLFICFANEFLNPVIGRPVPLDFKNIILHLTYLHGLFPEYIRSIFSVVWSLTPEVVFYCLFPFLYRSANKKLILLFLISLIASKYSLPISELIFQKTSTLVEIWAGLSPIGNMLFFIFGMLLYKNKTFFENKWVQFISAAAIVMFLIFPICPPGKDFIKVFSLFFYNYQFALVLFSFPFLVYNSLSLTKLILDNKFVTFIGKISYSAFFIHYAIILVFLEKNINFDYLLAFILILSLTIPISYLTFQYIERPGIKFGNYLINIFINRKIEAKSMEIREQN